MINKKDVDIEWKVVPNLFSGRPNPEWILSKAQIAAWELLWEKAVVSNKLIEPKPILGYNGCTLQTHTALYWFVVDGLVGLYDTTTIIVKEDSNAQMEQFLLHTAPKEIKELLQQINII
jgi:hypothetical protein